jgi:hypothetical protein
MTTSRAQRIERIVDAGAAAVLAAAAGYCALRLSWQLGSAAAFAGLCLVGSFVLLRSVGPTSGRFRISDFAIADVPAPPEELLLTDADRVPEEAPTRPDELLLDDVLARLGPDSRVVRLFDRAAMPTPGELRARIDRHLDGGRESAPAPDASQALHEALAELRRSLR